MIKQRNIFVIALVLITVILILHILEYKFVCDDAFISFRYARNLADGYGPVFNPGERVEGYTNFLWVVILAGLALLGAAPHITAVPLNIIISLVFVFVLIYYNHRLFARKRYDLFILIAPLFLAFNRTFAVWSSGGLETRLFTLLIFIAIANLLLIELRKGGRYWMSALFFALAALTRPEGILLFGIFFGLQFLIKIIKRENIKRLIRSSFIFVIIVGAHFVFRILYYGYPFPNTFYAKVTGVWIDMGLLYQFTFIHEYGLYLFMALAVFIFSRYYDSRKRPALIKLLIGFSPYFVYLILIGGDHFEYRPIDVFIPFMLIILQESLRAGYEYIKAIKPRIAETALSAGIFIILLFYIIPGWLSHINFQIVYDSALGVKTSEKNILARIPVVREYLKLFDRAHGKLAGSFVCIRQEEHKMAMEQVFHVQATSLKKLVDRGIIEKDEIIALDCVGAIPYYSELPTIDKLGLTDSHVAHQRGTDRSGRLMGHEKITDMDYLRQRGVTYIAVHPSRFFYHRDSLYREGKFNLKKLKPYSFLIPADSLFLVFRSAYTPESIGPRLLGRGLEFYFVDQTGKIYHAEP